MVYEHRIYSCVPGQMPRLLRRFEDHTLAIWKKHGIRQVGFWRVLIGDDHQDLHYILAWDSLADRETRWNASWPTPSGMRRGMAAKRQGRSSPGSAAQCSSRPHSPR